MSPESGNHIDEIFEDQFHPKSDYVDIYRRGGNTIQKANMVDEVNDDNQELDDVLDKQRVETGGENEENSSGVHTVNKDTFF